MTLDAGSSVLRETGRLNIHPLSLLLSGAMANLLFFPLLAIVETTEIICIGVISNLCPNDIVANSTGPTLFSFKNILPASPGKSIPVFDNNPNFSK